MIAPRADSAVRENSKAIRPGLADADQGIVATCVAEPLNDVIRDRPQRGDHEP